MIRQLLILALIFSLNACQSRPPTSLYEELGGQPAIENIIDNYLTEISYDKQIARHFMDSNIDRVRSKLIEMLCNLSDGPCAYTGDTMLDVHIGMHITEAEFTRGVELLINAMNDAGIPHRTQNKLLARLAPLREDIIYH